MRIRSTSSASQGGAKKYKRVDMGERMEFYYNEEVRHETPRRQRESTISGPVLSSCCLHRGLLVPWHAGQLLTIGTACSCNGMWSTVRSTRLLRRWRLHLHLDGMLLLDLSSAHQNPVLGTGSDNSACCVPAACHMCCNALVSSRQCNHVTHCPSTSVTGDSIRNL